MTRIHASDMYAAGTRRSGSGDNPPATLQIKVAIEGYANDPTKLPNAFAATLMPTAKRKSDTTTIPIPTNLSWRPSLPSASFGCAMATFWIRKATTLLLAANITPIPKHTKAPLKVPKFPVMPLVCWAMARFPRNASKVTEGPPFSRSAAWMAAVHSWRGHRHRGETTALLRYLGLKQTAWHS